MNNLENFERARSIINDWPEWKRNYIFTSNMIGFREKRKNLRLISMKDIKESIKRLESILNQVKTVDDLKHYADEVRIFRGEDILSPAFNDMWGSIGIEEQIQENKLNGRQNIVYSFVPTVYKEDENMLNLNLTSFEIKEDNTVLFTQF